MSTPQQDVYSLINEIKSREKELEEIQSKMNKTSFLKKFVSGDVDKSYLKHLKALIKNKKLQLNIGLQKYLMKSNVNYTILAKRNLKLLQTDQFELRLLKKHDSVLNVLADLNSIHEYYKTPSTFFKGGINEKGILELNPIINVNITSGLPQTGIGIEWEGEIDYMGMSHLILTETKPYYPKPFMMYPYRYSGSISSEGIIKLKLSEKVSAGTPLIGLFTGGPFEKEKQKGIEFNENKKEMEKLIEDLKKESWLK